MGVLCRTPSQNTNGGGFSGEGPRGQSAGQQLLLGEMGTAGCDKRFPGLHTRPVCLTGLYVVVEVTAHKFVWSGNAAATPPPAPAPAGAAGASVTPSSVAQPVCSWIAGTRVSSVPVGPSLIDELSL